MSAKRQNLSPGTREHIAVPSWLILANSPSLSPSRSLPTEPQSMKTIDWLMLCSQKTKSFIKSLSQRSRTRSKWCAADLSSSQQTSDNVKQSNWSLCVDLILSWCIRGQETKPHFLSPTCHKALAVYLLQVESQRGRTAAKVGGRGSSCWEGFQLLANLRFQLYSLCRILVGVAWQLDALLQLELAGIWSRAQKRICLGILHVCSGKQEWFDLLDTFH